MRVRVRCAACDRPQLRVIRDDGTWTPCQCGGGVMVKNDRSGDKRVAVAKADLQHFDARGAGA